MRMRLRRGICAVLPLLALVAGGQRAEAALVLPGDAGIVVTATAATGFEDILATTTQAYVSSLGAGDISGLVYAAVFQESLAANPLGGLTFAYQITNNASSSEGVEFSTETDFAGFTTDVYYATNGSLFGLFDVVAPTGPFFPTNGTEPPLTANRSFSGTVVTFDWTSGSQATLIGPGETSFVFLIRTDAPDWVPGTTSLQNGGVDTVPTFAPAAAPEPATMLLFATALLGLGARLRRRP